jgi:hypothetical protein
MLLGESSKLEREEIGIWLWKGDEGLLQKANLNFLRDNRKEKGGT